MTPFTKAERAMGCRRVPARALVLTEIAECHLCNDSGWVDSFDPRHGWYTAFCTCHSGVVAEDAMNEAYNDLQHYSI